MSDRLHLFVDNILIQVSQNAMHEKNEAAEYFISSLYVTALTNISPFCDLAIS